MRHQALAQEVVPAERVSAGPEDEQHARRADTFARMQRAMHQLLTRMMESKPVTRVATSVVEAEFHYDFD